MQPWGINTALPHDRNKRLLGSSRHARNFGVSGATALKRGNQPIWHQPSFAEATNFAPGSVIIILGLNHSKTRTGPPMKTVWHLSIAAADKLSH